MTTHPACGATWTAATAEHCASCHRTFTGTSTGDRHRTGPFDARRCLTDAEMAESGLKRDPRGIWGTSDQAPGSGGLAAWRVARDAVSRSCGHAPSASTPLAGVSAWTPPAPVAPRQAAEDSHEASASTG